MSAAGVNIYIRAMNSFCSWLTENGHISQAIVLKQLKNHPKPVTVFSETEVRTLLANKPKRLTYLRTWTMIVLMLDTGCRIDEVLNLKAPDIDFDNLLLTVNGKGSKIRRVPLSVEGRKHLWTYCQRVKTEFLFGRHNIASRFTGETHKCQLNLKYHRSRLSHESSTRCSSSGARARCPKRWRTMRHGTESKASAPSSVTCSPRR
jgi:site-specific recombinase XerD